MSEMPSESRDMSPVSEARLSSFVSTPEGILQLRENNALVLANQSARYTVTNPSNKTFY